MRICGVPKDNVSLGLYGADSSLFYDGVPLLERPKRIIYVGQFIGRKNVCRMIHAFLLAKKITGVLADEWRIDLYGAGMLADEIKDIVMRSGCSAIGVHPFCQPENLAAEYRDSRVFCLPSLEDHWGVVVHEAALSGCALLLANGIGAGKDFLGKGNGIAFDPFSVDDMAKAMSRIICWDDVRWRRAHDESVRLSSNFGLNRFVEATVDICTKLC